MRVRDIRMLARDRADLDPRSRGLESPNFIQSVESAVREYAELPPRMAAFHWERSRSLPALSHFLPHAEHRYGGTVPASI